MHPHAVAGTMESIRTPSPLRVNLMIITLWPTLTPDP